MASEKPAGMTVYRTRTTRPTPVGAALILAMFLAATAALVGAGHLLSGAGSSSRDGVHTRLPSGDWPSSGQAAIVIGGGRPAASPDQEPVQIASLAKVMTAYLVLERYPLDGNEEGFEVTVTAAEELAETEEAAAGGSVVAVEAGERLSERQLLEALLIPSGNNVAGILAARVAGGEAAFVEEMNAEAEALGMDETTYADPSGFDPDTVSTAADQLRVFRRAMRFAVFRRIVSTASTTLPVAGTLANFNPLVAAGYGGKTGSSSAAGGCLAFFTRVTVNGRPRTAVGVVTGQGEGSDTAAVLAAAGEAARRLVAAARTGT